MANPTIIYNGENFLTEFKFTLGKIPYQYASPPKVPLIERSWGDGGVVADTRLASRRIEITGKIAAASLSEAKTLLEEMSAALHRPRGERSLVVSTYDSTRQWQAVLASAIDVQWVGVEPFPTFTMLAADPRAIVPTEKTQSQSGNSPIAIVVPGATIGGTSQPELIVEINPNGHLVGDKFVSTSLLSDRVDIFDMGATFENDADFRVRVNTFTKAIEFSFDAGVNWDDSGNGFLKELISWPSLQTSFNNTVTVSGFSDGTDVDLRWFSKYA